VAVIAAGGAIGGGVRYSLTRVWPHDGFDFPWATFAANVSGSLLLGALMVFLLDVWGPHRYTRPFLGVGVLGGFTTFSAFTNEVDALLRGGQSAVALVYIFASLAAGLLATLGGIVAARRIAGPGNPRRMIR
jgi:CrcB protein